ncbi:hypothetical protein [Roseisolibacter agri]|nr:hypothetical protein [Roseisolibacter agri]
MPPDMAASYVSSDTSIAIVRPNRWPDAWVVGVKPGKVTISLRDAVATTTEVATVLPRVATLAWATHLVTLRVGDTARVQAFARDSRGQVVGTYGAMLAAPLEGGLSADVLFRDTITTVIGRHPGATLLEVRVGSLRDSTIIRAVPAKP